MIIFPMIVGRKLQCMTAQLRVLISVTVLLENITILLYFMYDVNKAMCVRLSDSLIMCVYHWERVHNCCNFKQQIFLYVTFVDFQ